MPLAGLFHPIGMRIHRFKVDDLTGPVAVLNNREAVHALRVLRLNLGAQIELFDGRGRIASGRISAISLEAVAVSIESVREARSDAAALILAVAPPKGERADWLVEKCAELGVSALWWLATERGVVKPGATKLERWRRKADEAAKQAETATTLALEPPRDLVHILTLAADARIYYGEPRAEACGLLQELRATLGNSSRGARVLVLIGPEGGFTPEEGAQIERAGGRPVRWSAAVLRTETAAVAAAACWSAILLESPNE
jgi:16S rRNA (uracil1498-N3)-methyltransferase